LGPFSFWDQICSWLVDSSKPIFDEEEKGDFDAENDQRGNQGRRELTGSLSALRGACGTVTAQGEGRVKRHFGFWFGVGFVENFYQDS